MSSTSTWGMATRSGSDGRKPFAFEQDPSHRVLWKQQIKTPEPGLDPFQCQKLVRTGRNSSLSLERPSSCVIACLKVFML